MVAVSGGADSSALLAAVAELQDRKKLAVEIVAAHFNHKLREDSDADERFVKELAARFGAAFVGGKGKLTGKSDLEQRARKARYAFLEKTARNENASLVLTAHTLNDQAETFLINLVRGSGPAGLAAMPVMRPLSRESKIQNPKSKIDLVRPLLHWATRADTEAFCNQKGIEFRRDAMNDDPRFTRVRVRKEIIPKLAELNPKIVDTLARTAALLSEPGAVATGSPYSRPESTSNDNSALPLEDLRRLESAELYQLLRSWLRSQRGHLRGVTLKHVQAIEALTHSSKSGRVTELPDGKVVKSGGFLRFLPCQVVRNGPE